MTDPYDVRWSGPARHSLSRLPEKVAAAAVEFSYGPLAREPRRGGHPLRFELASLYSARRGDHRIVYRVAEAEHAVLVEAIRHRADAYRPR